MWKRVVSELATIFGSDALVALRADLESEELVPVLLMGEC